jgi:hypothetical protein
MPKNQNIKTEAMVRQLFYSIATASASEARAFGTASCTGGSGACTPSFHVLIPDFICQRNNARGKTPDLISVIVNAK